MERWFPREEIVCLQFRCVSRAHPSSLFFVCQTKPRSNRRRTTYVLKIPLSADIWYFLSTSHRSMPRKTRWSREIEFHFCMQFHLFPLRSAKSTHFYLKSASIVPANLLVANRVAEWVSVAGCNQLKYSSGPIFISQHDQEIQRCYMRVLLRVLHYRRRRRRLVATHTCAMWNNPVMANLFPHICIWFYFIVIFCVRLLTFGRTRHTKYEKEIRITLQTVFCLMLMVLPCVAACV